MTRTLIFTGVVSLALLASKAIGATTILVPNFSFEQDALSFDGGNPGASGWTQTGSIFTENPSSSSFSGADGSGTPPGGLGAQSLYVGTNSSVVSGASLDSITVGSTYTLTVAVGDRFGFEPGVIRIGFLLDDLFVLGGDTSFDASAYSPEGEFTDYSFEYTSQPGDAGKSIKIFLGMSSGQVVNYDNVRLSVVPEPSSLFLVLSGVALILRRRNRRA